MHFQAPLPAVEYFILLTIVQNTCVVSLLSWTTWMGHSSSAFSQCCAQALLENGDVTEYLYHVAEDGEVSNCVSQLEQRVGTGLPPALGSGRSKFRGEDGVMSCCSGNANHHLFFCCSGSSSVPQVPSQHPQLESLNHIPDQYDEIQTIDVERSTARYTQTCRHCNRGRAQKLSKPYEVWLRAAMQGMAVTLVVTSTAEDCGRTPALFYLDQDLSELYIVPVDLSESWSINFFLDNIEVISPVLPFDAAASLMDETENSRAILLQYVKEGSGQNHVCFFVESEVEKANFMQALSDIWFEKRSVHNMWF